MKKPAAAAHAATHVKQKPAAARRNRSGKSNWAKWKTLRKQEKEKEKEKEKLRETVSETEKQQEKTFRDIGVQTVAAVKPGASTCTASPSSTATTATESVSSPADAATSNTEIQQSVFRSKSASRCMLIMRSKAYIKCYYYC